MSRDKGAVLQDLKLGRRVSQPPQPPHPLPQEPFSQAADTPSLGRSLFDSPAPQGRSPGPEKFPLPPPPRRCRRACGRTPPAAGPSGLAPHRPPPPWETAKRLPQPGRGTRNHFLPGDRLAPPPPWPRPLPLPRWPRSPDLCSPTLSQWRAPRLSGSGLSSCALCRPFPPLHLCPGRMRHLPLSLGKEHNGHKRRGPRILEVKGQGRRSSPLSHRQELGPVDFQPTRTCNGCGLFPAYSISNHSPGTGKLLPKTKPPS